MDIMPYLFEIFIWLNKNITDPERLLWRKDFSRTSVKDFRRNNMGGSQAITGNIVDTTRRCLSDCPTIAVVQLICNDIVQLLQQWWFVKDSIRLDTNTPVSFIIIILALLSWYCKQKLNKWIIVKWQYQNFWEKKIYDCRTIGPTLYQFLLDLLVFCQT